MRRLLDAKVGPVPLPLYAILFAIVFTASAMARLPADMIGGFAVIMIAGWLLGDIGMKVPVLRTIGGPAMLSIFAPAILVYYKLINTETLNAVTAIMKTSNFLYLYISCLICGSIFGMNRKVLIKGFLRMFFPLILGEMATISIGIGVGLLFGYTVYKTFFMIIVPMIGGGIGEGVLPYSLAMSEIVGRTQASIIPQLIPAVMLSNLMAIVAAGLMKRLGEKHPQYSGSGLLVKTDEDKQLLAEAKVEKPIEYPLLGIGLALACCLFIFGSIVSRFIGIPAAINMIFIAMLIKYLRLLPARMEQGAYQMYRFITTNLTWPLLVGLGVLYTSWKDVVAAVTPAYVAVCVSCVIAMWITAFFVGKFMKMYPIESAVVTGCHTGMGGTGAVAILSAADVMGLMPFAQVATRLGGAWMIVLATLLLKVWH